MARATVGACLASGRRPTGPAWARWRTPGARCILRGFSLLHAHDASQRFSPVPAWATATVAVASLLANSLWRRVSQADGTTAFVLMFACLLGWPLTTGLIAMLLGGAIGLWEDHPVPRLAVLFGVAGVTLAVYGMPRLWNLLVCAAIAITVGLRLQRAAQDEADLERL